jgi:hypothetical protein
MPWAGGRRGAAGGLARLLQGSPFLTKPTKEADPKVGRTDHDFTQHSVIRRRTKRQRSGARVEGAPFGEGPTRSGTATDYGCCVMAMDAGGVTDRTL